VRVLGIDPGTRIIGFGFVETGPERCRALEFGVLRIDQKHSSARRLKQIHEFVSGLVDRLRPDAVAVEEVFVSQNARTTLRLGHARGVILLSVMEAGIEPSEYAPREIKKAVLGQGGASKDQVRWMMARLLNLDLNTLEEDAADALAAALCHGLRAPGIAVGLG
jgi:crossover junction endodeoxyribonuclease RuvC